MSAKKKIKQILAEKDMKVSDLAKKMGLTKEYLSVKLYRDTFSYKEYEKIADLLDCDVVTIMRDTKKMF